MATTGTEIAKITVPAPPRGAEGETVPLVASAPMANANTATLEMIP
jgi:hypothetical protein